MSESMNAADVRGAVDEELAHRLTGALTDVEEAVREIDAALHAGDEQPTGEQVEQLESSLAALDSLAVSVEERT